MNEQQPRTLEEEKERGRRAQAVLNDPLYQEAWKAVADALASQRRRCPIKDTDMAVRLVLAEQMLIAVRGGLEDFMATGKMAEIQIAQREESKKRQTLLERVGLAR